MGKPCVLVALDGSETAEAALPYAEAQARCRGSGLQLLQVLGNGYRTGAGGSAVVVTQHHEEIERRAKAYLAQTATEIRHRGLSVETLVRFGQAPEAIVQAADDCDAAMLVLVSYGHGGVKRWLLGTTAQSILCRMTRPVLLIHPTAAPAYETAALPLQILVPLDGSPQAEAALPVARDLARRTGAAILLAGVVSGDGPQVVPGQRREEQSTAAEEEQAARGYLNRVADDLQAPGKVEPIVLRGRVAEALIAFARGHHIDLLLMSTRGHHESPRTVLSPITDALARSGVPVLFITPGSTAAALDHPGDAAQPALDLLSLPEVVNRPRDRADAPALVMTR